MHEVRTLQRLWFAFASTQMIFPVVAFVARPPETEPDPVILMVLGGLMVVESGFGLVGVPLLFRNVPASSAFLIRFAVFEAVSIFGFVGTFLGGPMALSIAGSAVAVGLLATAFPTDERYTAWEVRRLGEQEGDDR